MSTASTAAGPRVTSTQLLAFAANFEGNGGEFLHRLLALQCQLVEAEAGVLFRARPVAAKPAPPPSTVSPEVSREDSPENLEAAEAAQPQPTQTLEPQGNGASSAAVGELVAQVQGDREGDGEGVADGEGEVTSEGDEDSRAVEMELEVIAAHPALRRDRAMPQWLAGAIEGLKSLLASEEAVASAVVEPDRWAGMLPAPRVLLVPLRAQRAGDGVAAFLIHAHSESQVQQYCRLLELTAGLVTMFEMRMQLRQRQQAVRSVRAAVSVLSAVNEQTRLQAAGMAFCNQLATLYGAERVALGYLSGRYVKLRAMSHTERFTRKMQVVQDLEAAMEEALDQDSEVAYPTPEGAGYVNRAAAELSKRHGQGVVCCLPLRRAGKVEAVLALERSADRPFAADEIERLRLTAELCTARLLDLYATDRWFGARWVNATRKGLAGLVGPQHTWAKVAALAVLGLLLFAFFVQGPIRTDATFVVEAQTRQVVPAPFDGYLATVDTEPGDEVIAGKTVLATLDTADLRLEKSAAQAEYAAHMKESELALREGKTSEGKIAEAQARQSQARIDLLQHQIEQATLIAPITGKVVEGDLKKQLGAPVKTGDVLFEIAPVEAIRAKLYVPDTNAGDVRKDQVGQLAAAAFPGHYLKFHIERVNPVAEVVNNQNVIAVRAILDESDARLRPGMEGLAKIDTGRANYLTIWTRDLVNWVRMKLWL
jgi:biotin carboxyl carrier protein